MILLFGSCLGFVLGPVLFNIYVNYLFFTLFSVNVCNFANDTTPFACHLNLDVFLTQLEESSELAIAWFQNTDKCHLLVAGHKFEHTWVRVGPDKIWEDHSVKLLGVSIDNFKYNKKAHSKFRALSRMTKFMTFQKKRTFYKVPI